MASRKNVIEEVVEDNPGLGFSQLKERTGLCNGVLEYNLRKSDKIEEEKGALIPVSYCSKCSLNSKCNQRCILKELRKESTKEIIKMISEGSTQAEIARNLDKDRSTVNYHVKKLKNMNILSEESDGIKIENVGKFY